MFWPQLGRPMRASNAENRASARKSSNITSAFNMGNLPGARLERRLEPCECTVVILQALKRQKEADLLSARVRLLGARLALDQARHLRVPQAIDALLQIAIRNLRGARSELANPSSLPPSFRN
jgi:hypothetical protein